VPKSSHAACHGSNDPINAISAAQQGEFDALGLVLDAFRDDLKGLADRSLGDDLAAKVSPSDLVQETFLAARRDFEAFRGRSPAELKCWLRSILFNRIANTRRYFRRSEKRRIDREVPLEYMDRPECVDQFAEGILTSPSRHAMRLEAELALATALYQLPEHYRRVVLWHHQERLTFEQIAGRLGISGEAARKLWGRALIRLRDALGPIHDPR
jgi:RNA polymerase sigma-70 factor (ECF subfamily)